MDVTGTLLARYAQGEGIDEPITELRGSTAGYYLQDGLASVTSITGTNGSQLNSGTYDAFGNHTASTGSIGNPFQYTGRDFDSETGLHYYRKRYYDASTGRFLSEDPLGYNSDGPNFYSYSRSNPVNLIDPNGLQSVGRVILLWNRLQDWLEGTSDAADMATDFLGGTGPQTQNFGPGTVQVSSLVHSPGINKARDYYKKRGCDSSGSPRPVSGGHKFGLKGLVQSGFDPTLQYVGSYDWTIVPNADGTITYTIADDKSMTSLLYHIWPSSWSWSRDPFHKGWSLPGGVTTQTYNWTEPLGKNTCGCQK